MAAPDTELAGCLLGTSSVRAGDVLEEIVVTARRVEENIQDVPVAVTAFDAETLTQTTTLDVIDLQRLVPNFVAAPGPGQPTALILMIRGQVQADIIGTLDPSVGVYHDGIYIARPHGANVALFDVANVQVLRGPQGTLFGRNTTGGAILVTTNDPDFEGYSGSVSGTLASFGKRQLTGVLNLPLIEERLAVRMAARTTDSDGFGFDRTNQRDLGTDVNDVLRAKILFEPHDDARFVLGGEYIDLDQIGPPAGPIHALTLDEVVGAGQVPGLCCLTSIIDPDYNSFAGGNPFEADFDPGLVPRIRAVVRSLTLNGRWEFPWFVAEIITGVRENADISSRVDVDGGPRKIVDTTQFNDNRQTLYELQLNGSLFGDRLDWVLGGTHFTEDGSDNGHTLAFHLNPLLPPDLLVVDTRGDIRNEGRGLFSQADYALTDRWTVTGGIRYSFDRKRLKLRATTSGLVCSIPEEFRDEPGECRATFDDDFDDVSYHLSSRYRLFDDGELFDDATVYASVTTGYRSGGQNLRGADARTLAPFGPETLRQYEIGLKSEMLTRRVRLNVAGFFTEYDDVQRTTIIAVNGVPATVVENAAEAEVAGLEVELWALPFDGAFFGGTFGLTLPEYLEFVNLAGRDRSDEDFDLVPKSTFSLWGAYATEVFGLGWINRIDYAWRDDIPTNVGSIQYFKQRGFDPTDAVTVDASGFLGARSSLLLPYGAELAVYGLNLTDTVREGALALGEGPDFIVGLAGTPGRQIGAEVRIEF